MFITFEGVEGSGKTTQITHLKNFLEAKNKKVIVTREPGGSVLGGKIRHLILDPEQEDKPSNLAELFLYIADRSHHVETIIEPALKQGVIVISDRYVDSTIAYQGFARNGNIEDLLLLNKIATKNIKPDITFVMDIDPEFSFKRIKNRSLDRIESEKMEFHKKVRNGFLTLGEKEPNRIKIIKADSEEQLIRVEIEKIIESFIN